MSIQKARVEWIDIVKYICIMWVMLSHLEADTDLLRQFYSPFFLNGFFFASGYVYFHKKGFKNFLIKKIKGLFVPWLFFSVFNIILSQILTFNEHSSLLEELKWNFFQIRGLGDGLWFIAALFVAFIPFYFFIDRYENSNKDNKSKGLLLIISFILSMSSSIYSRYMNPNLLPWGKAALPWHLEYLFAAMFWMVIGYLFSHEYEIKYDSLIDKKIKIGSIILFILLRYIPFVLGFEFENRMVNICYIYISAFIAVFGLIYVSKIIKPNKYFLYIGQNTLICFALHGKIHTIIQTILRKVTNGMYTLMLDNTLASSIFAMVFAIVLSIVLIIPIYIINRWFPFLVGRQYKKN